MKSIIYHITIVLFFVSCNLNKKQKANTISKNEAIISYAKKNKNNIDFELKNGVLYFLQKPYTGIVEAYYTNKKIKSRTNYYQGKKHGFFNGWYENGKKWFERFYTNGFKTGVHKGWFDNGNKMFEYHFNTSGMYDGKITEWYKNGNLSKEFHYKQGKEEGSQKMWQPTGKIKANFVTKKGERFGLIGLKKCFTVNTTNERIK